MTPTIRDCIVWSRGAPEDPCKGVLELPSPRPISFLDCKHLGIVVTHRAILVRLHCAPCSSALPSGLTGGPIVLEGFVGNLFRSEPGSTQEEKEVKYLTK
jgi:hypothetical protein